MFYKRQGPSRFVVDLRKERENRPIQSIERPVSSGARWASYRGRFEQAPFFPFLKGFFRFLKLFFKNFYRFFFWIGWAVIFILRLAYLFPASIFKTFSRGLKPPSPYQEPVPDLIGEEGQGVRSFFKKDVLLRPARPELAVKQLEMFPVEKKRLKSILIFAGILLLFALPFKGVAFLKTFDLFQRGNEIKKTGQEGVSNLMAAAGLTSSLDFSQAKDKFSQAGESFFRAREEAEGISRVLAGLSALAPREDFKLAGEGGDILKAGEKAARLGENLASAMDALFASSTESFRERTDRFIVFSSEAAKSAEELEAAMNRIKEKNLPEEYRQQFSLAKESLTSLHEGLEKVVDLAKGLKVFWGEQEDKRYLLVFQNNAELRASGGFIGSYALIDFKNGKIKNVEAPGGGSYDTEAGLKARIAAPEPLWLVNPLWHFWDANWWPDWPFSARKLAWFYEKSDGPTVDGVISLTPTAAEKFLSAIGPIDMSAEYGLIFSADNLWLALQELAEKKPEETREPKKVIGDLFGRIIEELPKRLNQESALAILAAAEESLNGKHLLFYFQDKDLQKRVEKYDWSGKVKKSPRDYLQVVNTNIAGAKTDRRIRETIEHESEIRADGSVVNTLRIKREHTGVKLEPFSGVRNVNWLRVYVPRGSELLEAQGFRQPDKIYFSEPEPGWEEDEDVKSARLTEKTDSGSGTKIYSELGYTVFANWTMTDPGETSIVYLRYKLPFKIEEIKAKSWLEKIRGAFGLESEKRYVYSLLVQKQPGAKPSLWKSVVKIAPKFSLLWHYPASDLSWDWEEELDSDKYGAMILKEKF